MVVSCKRVAGAQDVGACRFLFESNPVVLSVALFRHIVSGAATSRPQADRQPRELRRRCYFHGVQGEQRQFLLRRSIRAAGHRPTCAHTCTCVRICASDSFADDSRSGDPQMILSFIDVGARTENVCAELVGSQLRHWSNSTLRSATSAFNTISYFYRHSVCFDLFTDGTSRYRQP